MCPICNSKAKFKEIGLDEAFFTCTNTDCEALLTIPFYEEDEPEEQETLDF